MNKLLLKIKRYIVVTIASVLAVSTCFIPVASADYSTGVGLAAHALNAYYQGWSYVYGGSSPGAVDCSGLICTYNGVGGIRTSMLASSPESGYVYNGIPNIHGLGLYQPGHVGVYVGGGMAVDARNEYYGVCYQSVYTKSWTSWFKVSGVSYPNTGWVKFQGDSYYYENGEYITNTTREIDGGYYTFDAYGKSDYSPDDSAYLATDYSSVNVSSNYSYQNDSTSEDYSYNNDDYTYTEPQSSSKSSSKSTKSSGTKYTALYNGYMGKDVEKLQKRLKTLGFFDTDVTDFYGSVTQSAVCEFQEAASLDITGVADEETLKAVYADDAPMYQFNELTLGDYSDETLNIQTRLQELGYFYDTPTGYFGEVTAIAVSQFQSANGLYSTGVVDSLTSDLIYDEYAVANPNEGTISYGMKGDSVRAIQQRLIDLRYLIGSPTDEFDDDTLDALHIYQNQIGEVQTDYLTSEQISALYSSTAPKSPDYDMLKVGYIGDDVKDLQIKLMALDLYDGLLSGYFDDATRLAVTAAQKRYGLSQTGNVTPQLLEKLTNEQLSRSAQANDDDVVMSETIAANAFESAAYINGDSVVLKDKSAQSAVKLILLAVIIFMTIVIVIMLNKMKKTQLKANAYSDYRNLRSTKREKIIRR
ncbi:MAG: peptidoglycan-binding protein [Clostridiales bacterium]|nr:peptidoglycan-binding protein [Clostridiales bacterium]